MIIYQETEVNDLDDVAEKMVEMIWMMLLNELVRCGCRRNDADAVVLGFL